MIGPGLVEQSPDKTNSQGPSPNDILPRLAGVKYLMLIDVSSEYPNLKLDE